MHHVPRRQKILPSKAAIREAAASAKTRAEQAAVLGKEHARRGLLQGAEHAAALRDAAERSKALLHERAMQLPQFEFQKPDTTTFALLGTTFNLLNATTGPGLLALPLAFSRCGWLLGTLLLLLVFALNHTALSLLLKSCLQTREHSYIGLSLRHGPELAAAVDWASLLFFFGSCVSYLVIIGDAFGQFTASLGQPGPWYIGGGSMHFSYYGLIGLVAFTITILAPLSMLRSMDSLQVTSGVSMICILYAVAIVVIAPGYSASSTAIVPPTVALESDALPDAAAVDALRSPRAAILSSQALLSLPTMAFCFASQPLFPPALETLHQPATYEYMHLVVNLTMGLTLLLHLLVALGGYLRYGALVSANILDALPSGPLVAIARGAIVLAFAFTYPMMIFLSRMHIQSIMARFESLHGKIGSSPSKAKQAAAVYDDSMLDDGDADAPSQESSKHGGTTKDDEDNDHHTLISTILIALTLLTAILFPDIDALFGLLGGTTAVVISFIAPSLFWEKFVGFMYGSHAGLTNTYNSAMPLSLFLTDRGSLRVYVCCRYKPNHSKRLLAKGLLGFAILVAALSLPAMLVDMVGDLYATAWFVPLGSSGDGLGKWKGEQSNSSKPSTAHSQAAKH